MGYSKEITLDLPHADAVAAVKEKFKEHGFGTLTEIDVAATLDEKIGRKLEPYTILGVCNPELASRALDVHRDVGLLLPCTVVVTQGEGGAVVKALDPQVMVSVPNEEGLQPIADEAAGMIDQALDALGPKVEA